MIAVVRPGAGSVARAWSPAAAVVAAAALFSGCQAQAGLGIACARASECSSPLVCTLGRCRAQCATSRDCPIAARCLADPATGIGACSLVDVDDCGGGGACASGLVCHDAKCVNACGSIVQCPDGVCQGSVCIPQRDPIDGSVDAAPPDASVQGDASPDDVGIDAGDDAGADATASSDAGIDAFVPPDDAWSCAADDVCAVSCTGATHLCAGACVPDDVFACGTGCARCTAIGGVAACAGGACAVDCGAPGSADDGSWIRSSSTTCLWNAPALSALVPAVGTLVPAFVATTLTYDLTVPLSAASLDLVPTSSAPMASEASITIDGAPVASGTTWTSAPLPLGRSTHVIVVTAEGGASVTYTIRVERGLALGHYLKASHPGPNDDLGLAVAIDGDTMVIGAPLEDSNTTGVDGDSLNDAALDAGAAYVFVRSGSTWVQQAYLKASNTETGDEFGDAVAISGDTIVVGASLEDSSATGVNNSTANGASDSGAAYVFVRNAGVWTQQAYLKASNTDAGDHFGRAVGISADTIIVGADGEQSSASVVNGNQASNSRAGAGAAYVFLRTGSSWAQQAYLKASNTDAGDAFGWSVAISGDTAVVGADGEASAARTVDGTQSSNAAAGAGAAYVFFRTGTTWAQQAYLKASNSDASDLFGSSVSISGDTVIVGAPGEDGAVTGVTSADLANAAASCGAAYAFVRTGVTWAQQAYLKPAVSAPMLYFGSSVAISGSLVVIGANGDDSAATGVLGDPADTSAVDAGAAHAFLRDASLAWSAVGYLKASNTGSMDHLGAQVGVSGTSVVVCAPYEDGSSPGVDGPSNEGAGGAGACYTFEG